MFGIGGSVRIYYCPTPINLRKSFDGLAGAVEEYIKQDPDVTGHLKMHHLWAPQNAPPKT